MAWACLPAARDRSRTGRAPRRRATHKFAQACRDHGVGFSFGFPIDARMWDAVDTLNLADGWYPAIDSGGELRDGAWVAEATSLVNLSSWPAGTRLVLRKERPHQALSRTTARGNPTGMQNRG